VRAAPLAHLQNARADDTRRHHLAISVSSCCYICYICVLTLLYIQRPHTATHLAPSYCCIHAGIISPRLTHKGFSSPEVKPGAEALTPAVRYSALLLANATRRSTYMQAYACFTSTTIQLLTPEERAPPRQRHAQIYICAGICTWRVYGYSRY
jgi:hypothetical protein